MVDKQKVVFIVNPFSGTSDKQNFSTVVAEYIDNLRYDYLIQYTQAPGHAITLAKQCVEAEVDIVVAVGGDGTINEVATGLVESNTALGIIPAGSGNGFALHLGMSRDLKKAIRQINKGKVRRIDSCFLNGLFFINVAGLGFDAKVAYHTKTDSKRGFVNYLKRTLQLSSKYAAEELTIELDGKIIEGKYAAAVIANASRYGYVFTVAPLAKLNDGLLDVILFKDTFVPRYFVEAYRFVNNSIHKSSITETYTAKHIKITSKNQSYFHLDGEGHEKATHFEIKVVPDSISILTPEDYED